MWLERLFHFKRPAKNYSKELKSPNERLVCRFNIQNGRASYSLFKDGKELIGPSRLGFSLRGQKPLFSDLAVVREHTKSEDETWETAWGEERTIRNHYNELTVYLAEQNEEGRIFTLRFRLFDDGLGFRYEIPPQPKFQRLTIADELTEFRINDNSLAWQIPAYQPDRYEYNYTRKPLYELTHSVHTPITIELPTGNYVAIHEAALYNYGSMTLRMNQNRALKSDITPLSDGMRAYIELPFNTPWRVVMIGDSANDLITNHIVLNLNDPPQEDFSWVKPIKFLGIWWAMFVGEWTWAPGERHGATTEHAKQYIDACTRLGIPGLLIEGWNNGWEGDWLENGATTDFLHPMADFNIDEVARYARERGVSLVGHHETVGFIDNYENQMEEAYKFYNQRGINYIKPGYAGSRMVVNGRKEYHHSQIGVQHYQKALELAAKYHICLDVHEPIKGTGIERTYPNLLTREGARGQEYEGGALSPSHATILPFTRLLAGGMDYTSGILDVSNYTKRMATTIARQVAYFVTIFSGMQMAADRPVFYEQKYPDLFKFIRDVPVSWEKTLPLIGRIGEYYVVARQARGLPDWYIGGVTNEEGHRTRINLDFLDEGTFEAEVYRDGETAHYRENQLAYVVEKKRVTKRDFLDIWMAPGGGFAVRLHKV